MSMMTLDLANADGRRWVLVGSPKDGDKMVGSLTSCSVDFGQNDKTDCQVRAISVHFILFGFLVCFICFYLLITFLSNCNENFSISHQCWVLNPPPRVIIYDCKAFIRLAMTEFILLFV